MRQNHQSKKKNNYPWKLHILKAKIRKDKI